MVEISVIIPAYNASGTIVRTLESIAAVCNGKVTYEIIVIDDASTDDTVDIIDQYRSKMYDVSMSDVCNLTLLRQPENHRQGAARNRGMEVAKGEYVMFVDADDTIGDGVLEQWQLAKAQKADVVCGKMDKIEKGEVTDVYATKMKSGEIVSGKEFCEKYFDFEVHVHPVIYLWRRAYLEKKKIQFIADRRFEDADWIEQNLFYAQSVGYVDAVVYHYFHAESTGSTTNTLSADTLGDWINLAYRQWGIAEKIKEESPIFCEKLIGSSRHIVGGHLSLRRLTRLSPKRVGDLFERVGEKEMAYLESKGEWGRYTTICFKAPQWAKLLLTITYPIVTLGRLGKRKIKGSKDVSFIYHTSI